jgi:hypothetical protein
MSLTTYESRAVDLLQANAWFDEVTVLPVSKGDVASLIGQRLGLIGKANPDQKIGLMALCGIHGGGAPDPGARKPYTHLHMAIAILENPKLNNTTGPKHALDAVEQVITTLWLRSAVEGVDDRNAVIRFVPQGEPLFELIGADAMASLYGVSGAVGYHVWFDVDTHL